MKITAAVFILFFTVPTWAASECLNGGHADQRACLERVADKTESAVRKAETTLQQRINSWDQEDEYKQKTFELIKRSSASFQSYKAAQCEVDASLAAGGNGAGDLRLMCVIALNRQYIKRLRVESQRFK